MKIHAQWFFELVDQRIDDVSGELLERLMNQETGLGLRLTVADSVQLQALLHDHMELLVWRILAMFTNVGASRPDHIPGWRIISAPEEGEPEPINDISDGYTDYTDLWHHYILEKEQHGHKTDT
jgi:hypothetical protein